MENLIHYRWAFGLRVVLQTMEASPKKSFYTYARVGIHSPVMIALQR